MPSTRATVSPVTARAGQVGGDDAHRAERRDRAGRGRGLLDAPLGQRRVELALPDAGGVVGGLAVPEHDEAARGVAWP